MSVPLCIQKAEDPFPFPITDHVAVRWRESIVIWGGYNYHESQPTDGSVVYCHSKGKWIRVVTSGDAPKSVWPTNVQVIEDQLLVRSDYHMDTMWSLDLNKMIWSKHTPKGYPPPEISFHNTSSIYASWVHGGKMYCFGRGCKSASNQLFSYNTVSDSWEWPLQYGDLPTPRCRSLTVISGDKVFLFGDEDKGVEYVPINDLYILDLIHMKWQKVLDMMPNEEDVDIDGATLTLISPTTALLFGSSKSWLLNLANAEKGRDASLIWTKIPHHFSRVYHAAVLKPRGRGLWVIGGDMVNDDGDYEDATSDVLEISFNLVPLRDLAMDYVARNIGANDDSLRPDCLPINLRKDIEEHRSNMVLNFICSAEKGCEVCKRSDSK